MSRWSARLGRRAVAAGLAALCFSAATVAAQQGQPVPPATQPPPRDTLPPADTTPTPAPAAPAPATPAPGGPQDGVQPAAGTPPGDTVPNDTLQAEAAARAAREAAAADTIFQALLRREGYTAMEYHGESANFRADERVLRLYGPAEVTRQGDRLTAKDTIVYREVTRFVEAYGEPSLSGQAETIEGNVMFYDLATRRATVRGGRTKVAEAGATWWVRGDVTAEGNSHIYASKSIFTTDDREEPAYYFEADNIKVIRDRILVGRPARLYFRNVPVFWLPFVAQDLTRGRRSGLLTPEFSVNDIVRNSSSAGPTRGTGRQISNLGFYWAMSDYMDAQLSGAWRSGDYTGLRGALRYRWNSQFLNGSLSYSQFWRDTGSRELIFNTNNSWQPDERTNLALNANFASSRFLREISTDYFQSIQNISSNFKLNRRFDWGAIDFGANRQQSVANDRVTMDLPQIGLMFQPITLFRETSPELQRWYSNATLSFSGSGARTVTSYGDGAPRHLRDEERTRVQVSQSFSVGNFGIGSGFNLNRTLQPEVAPADTFPMLPRIGRDEGSWQTSMSYRVGLIGETSLSPTLSLSQDLRGGTFGMGPPQEIPFRPEPLDTEGRYVTSPMRTSFGASLNTALYGFLPGFGPFSAIRHKLTPSFSYSYVPQVQLTPEQEQVFGPSGGFAQNNLSLLALRQTFEAKLRDTNGSQRQQETPRVDENGDTIPGADTTAQAAAPPEERKVTILSISTSGFNYDFEKARRGESGLTTRQVTNTISSDYMRGLQVTMSHDLFDASGIEDPRAETGRFSPKLTSLSTQFSLGEDSPFLRFLGLGGRVDAAPQEEVDSIPTEPLPSDPLDPTRRGRPFTNQPQAVGRGPWRLDVGYTLHRPRGIGTAAQDLQLGMSFAPTQNWAVNWHTNYSIEDGSFGGHSINLRRDLYRWEANFRFSRTPYGNTSFDVLVRLKDLPDLKVDYREHNIGANRR